MPLVKPGGALQVASQALATGSSAAHLAFLSLFMWRFVTGHGFRVVQGTGVIIAAAGLASGAVGVWLAKRKYVGRRFGLWATAISTVLAGVLLLIASFG